MNGGNNIDIALGRAYRSDVELFQPNKNLLFVLTGRKIIALTNNQTFILGYDHGRYKTRMVKLAESVRHNRINSIFELVQYCNFRTGHGSQMNGIEMIATKLERHV